MSSTVTESRLANGSHSRSRLLLALCTLVGLSSLTGAQTLVDAWADLATLDPAKVEAFVTEPGLSGPVQFVANSELPAWTQAGVPSVAHAGPGDWEADVQGLFVSHSSGTGKWIYAWEGPVEFQRLGPVYDGSVVDERNALNRLIHIAKYLRDTSGPDPVVLFDTILLGAGHFDGNLNVSVNTPMTLVGAGPRATIFHGDGIPSHTAFLMEASLRLSGLSFFRQSRLVAVEKNLTGDIRLKLEDVQYQGVLAPPDPWVSSPSSSQSSVAGWGALEPYTDLVQAQHTAIFAKDAGPSSNLAFRLEMDGCHFSGQDDQTYVHLRIGLNGYIRDSVFRGGRLGIVNIPNATGSAYPNPFSSGFRVSGCDFRDFDYSGTADSYHLQVTGDGWVISDCSFGVMSGTGGSGNLYSNLRNSQIVGCNFGGGGAYNIFFKGGGRKDTMAELNNGAGWGNAVLGCSFDGSSAGSAGIIQFAQIYMNVKEQRIVGCTFNDYPNLAILSNEKGVTGAADGGDTMIESCSFSSDLSPSAIEFERGGSGARIRNCDFQKIVGTSGANVRQGVIVIDNAGVTESVFEDIAVEGCLFRDCEGIPILNFYNSSYPAVVRRFTFGGNTVIQSPLAPDHFLQLGTSVEVQDMRVVGNRFEVEHWLVVGSGMGSQDVAGLDVMHNSILCNFLFVVSGYAGVKDLRLVGNTIEAQRAKSGDVNGDAIWVSESRDNDWIGSPLNLTADVAGVRSATRVDEQDVSMTGMLDPPADARVLYVHSGFDLAVPLAPGQFDGQRVVFVGKPGTAQVTVMDGGNADLGDDRLLEEGDTLELLWISSPGGVGGWTLLSYADN